MLKTGSNVFLAKTPTPGRPQWSFWGLIKPFGVWRVYMDKICRFNYLQIFLIYPGSRCRCSDGGGGSECVSFAMEMVKQIVTVRSCLKKDACILFSDKLSCVATWKNYKNTAQNAVMKNQMFLAMPLRLLLQVCCISFYIPFHMSCRSTLSLFSGRFIAVTPHLTWGLCSSQHVFSTLKIPGIGKSRYCLFKNYEKQMETKGTVASFSNLRHVFSKWCFCCSQCWWNMCPTGLSSDWTI